MSKSSYTPTSLLHRIGAAGPACSRATGGIGASSVDSLARSRPTRPVSRAAAIVFVLAVSVLGVLAPAAVAATAPPKIHHFPSGGGVVEEVHSTRVRLVTEVLNEGLVTKWHSEYSTSKSAVEKGEGILAGEGTSEDVGESAGTPAFVGGEEPSSYGVGERAGGYILRHLTPATTYYIRFVAENADGTTTETVEVKTLPVAKPEIVRAFRPEIVPESQTPGTSSFTAGSTSSSIEARVVVESNGAATNSSFAYSTSPSGPWIPFESGASGSISVAEDVGSLHASTAGLLPEKKYYVRLRASNAVDAIEEIIPVTTKTAHPVVIDTTVDNVTGSSARLRGSVEPHGSRTSWRFESAPSPIGPWLPVPGAAGIISQAEAAPSYGTTSLVSGALGGLSPSSKYYVRLFAENEAGEGEICHQGKLIPGTDEDESVCESIVSSTEGVVGLETEGPPSASAFATHALHGEAIRVLGSVDPNSTPLSEVQQIAVEGSPSGGTFTLAFDGHTTGQLAFDASAEQVREALLTLGSEFGYVSVGGPDGGPYVVEFGGPLGGSAQPLIGSDASGLTPSGSVAVSVVEAGGETYDTHYHFEYEGQRQFEAGGGTPFVHAVATPEVDLASSGESVVVGQDLPGLVAGETYRYRLVARSTFRGNPVVDGEEQSLTVAAPVIEPQAPCENEALRSGPSAHLPNCRAYEQVTPVDKNGAQELLGYGGSTTEGILVGEDGDHVMVAAHQVAWGTGPRDGQSPYFFSRTGNGWKLTAATAQPESGQYSYDPQVFSPDLTEFGFYANWETSDNAKAEDIEYKLGAPGGPYTTLPPVPRADVEGGELNVDAGNGWVAASEDFSKEILQVQDHTLLGPTHTKSGSDLYEYSGGVLRQVNVNSAGATIGSCGATIVKGMESRGLVSSSHALSADGSRVFFEAAPGKDCSEPANLYMRVGGDSTVDLGAYRFLAANAAGSEVMLVNAAGEVFLYETQTANVKRLTYGSEMHPLDFGQNFPEEGQYDVSADLSAIYFTAGKLDPEAPSGGGLYRYDVASGVLRFIAQGAQISAVSPDGDDLYFEAVAVPGVPAGGERFPDENSFVENTQVFRYDAIEGLLQCMSCASPFDPAPRLNANFTSGRLGEGGLPTNQGIPGGGFATANSAAANGDYVFFQTPAALVSSDVDGEVAPAGSGSAGEREEYGSIGISVSSDVYEWRKVGVEGCVHPQGCLSLITSGKGGFHNALLGTDESGRDVFFYTDESLVGRDNDTAGDIYDARVGGGFPEASRPVECEGDACSTPLAAPVDSTPASLAFSGPVNPTPVAAAAPKAKPKLKKSQAKKKKHRKTKKRARSGKKAKKSAKGRK